MSQHWFTNNSVDCIRVSDSEFTESGIMYTGEVCFCGIMIVADADVTINIYDNTEASGKKVTPTDCVICACPQMQIMTGQPIWCTNGLYLEITTTGTAKVKLLYDGAL